MFNPIAWFIARKYLFSKKSHSVINLISIISIIAVAIPAAAMVIILSVSNGFSDFVKQLNDTFDPNIKIEIEGGGLFEQNPPMIKQIRNIKNIVGITQFIENDCIIENNGKNNVVILRGIDSTYTDNFAINKSIIKGEYNKYNMLMGAGVAYTLGYNLGVSAEVSLYSAASRGTTVFGVNRQFNSDKISVSGIFMIDTFNDSKYVLANLGFCQNLFSAKGKISAIGITVDDLDNLDHVSKDIREIIPEGFIVKDRHQQRELDYAIVQQEKVAMIIMLVLIILIASLGLIGVVIMMMIEKREQLYVIGMLGGNEKLKKNIFKYQSLMMTFIGGIIGIVFGSLFCIIQQHYGFIRIGSDASLVDVYPTLLDWRDVIIVFITILIIGYIIAAITTRTMVSSKNSKKS